MSKEVKQLIDYLQTFINDDREEITKYGVEISQNNTKLLVNYIEQLQQENEHYKYILTEFEKWLEEKMNFYKNNFQGYSYERYKEVLDKLQELKGSDK